MPDELKPGDGTAVGHPFGLKQWQCPCGTANLEIRRKCRTCGKTELAATVDAKRSEIGDRARWQYRTPEEVSGLPLYLHGQEDHDA